jgi:hypothetical protein
MTRRCVILLIITFLILPSLRMCASPQLPNYIIFRGDTIATYNLILELYFQNQGTTDHGKLFGLSFRDGASLNCWRGYQAIYKFDNDTLFLADIISCGERRSGKIDKAASAQKMKTIFNDRFINGKVYMDWFSGDMSFPLNNQNNKVLRWDGVFYTIFEKETVISITNGKILNIADVDNYEDNPKAIDRKDKSKLSDILFKQLKKVRWKSTDKFDCSDKYLVTIGEDGKVSKVIMPEYPIQDSIDKYWDKDEYNYCINNVFKALQKLTFDIIKDKGKPISEDVYFEIWFDSRRKIENWTR